MDHKFFVELIDYSIIEVSLSKYVMILRNVRGLSIPHYVNVPVYNGVKYHYLHSI